MSRWIVGGVDFPTDPVDFVPRPVPDGVEVEWAGKDVDLGKMLETGEINALISADAPEVILANSPEAGRLFENYEAVERDHYRRTGVFPIMHGVAVKRRLVDERPHPVEAVYRAVCEEGPDAGRLREGLEPRRRTVDESAERHLAAGHAMKHEPRTPKSSYYSNSVR